MLFSNCATRIGTGMVNGSAKHVFTSMQTHSPALYHARQVGERKKRHTHFVNVRCFASIFKMDDAISALAASNDESHLFCTVDRNLSDCI